MQNIPSSQLNRLPKDVLIKIVSELNPPDFINFCLTDKTNKQNICDNPKFCLKKLESDYPYVLLTPAKYKISLKDPKNTYIREVSDLQKRIEDFLSHANIPLSIRLDPRERYEAKEQFEKDFHATIVDIFKSHPKIDDIKQYGDSLYYRIIEKHLGKYFGKFIGVERKPKTFTEFDNFISDLMGRERIKREKSEEYLSIK